MYPPPREVEITRTADQLSTEFMKAWRKRYGTNPHIELEDLPVFSFLAKNFGLDKGTQIIEGYVSSNDEWFIKQAHSPSALRKNINRVLAEYGQGVRRGAPNSTQISTPLTCDKCYSKFVWAGDPERLDRLRLCDKCKGKPA